MCFVKSENPHETVLEYDVFHTTQYLDMSFSYKNEIRLTYNAEAKVFNDYKICVSYGAVGTWEQIVSGEVEDSRSSKAIADFFKVAALALSKELFADLCKNLSEHITKVEAENRDAIIDMFSNLSPEAKAALLQKLSTNVKEDSEPVDTTEVSGAATAAAPLALEDTTILLGVGEVGAPDGADPAS